MTDLQNPPEEVNKLIVEIQKGYDAVYNRLREKERWFIQEPRKQISMTKWRISSSKTIQALFVKLQDHQQIPYR